jgi:hypothetical protein
MLACRVIAGYLFWYETYSYERQGTWAGLHLPSIWQRVALDEFHRKVHIDALQKRLGL